MSSPHRNCHLFIGPSLPDVQSLVSGMNVQIHPPIAGVDLLRLNVGRGDIVAIVDGYFHETRSVRHKEIFFALSSGARVLGASSMGALRAAELDRYGMVGIGGIYADYRDGKLEADDEVALLHGPTDTGYRPLSVPLVTIRATLEHAEMEGVCDGAMREALIEAMRRMPYMQRTYARLGDLARSLGMDRASAHALARFCCEHEVDRKRQDALLLLETLRSIDARSTEPEPPPLTRTAFLYNWQLEARGERTESGFASDLAALRVCQLFATDYPTYYKQWVFERIAEECRRDCGGRDGGPCAKDAKDARAMALAHGVHRGVYGASPSSLDFTTRWLTPDEAISASVDERLALFLVRSFRIAPGILWDEAVLDSLEKTASFARARDIARAAQQLNEDARRRHRRFAIAALSKDRVTEWLAARWGVPTEGLELAALERGMDVKRFIDAARPYYLLAKYKPTVTDLRLTV